MPTQAKNKPANRTETIQNTARYYELANKLSEATVTFPFSDLGLFKNQDNKGYVLQTWQPNALKVEVLEAKRNRVLAVLDRVTDSGLFKGVFGHRKQPFNYRLRITLNESTSNKSANQNENSYIVVDPYQFKEEAFYAVHHVDNEPQNIYNQLGAQLVALPFGKTPSVNSKSANSKLNAVRFAVYAPNAMSCSLIGDFNQWDGRRLPMQKTDCGHFVLVVPDLNCGDKYKFELKDQHGQVLPHKADPVGFYYEQYPSFASVIYDHTKYQWNDQDYLTSKADKRSNSVNAADEPMSIYEVHLGSWRMHESSHNQPQPLKYDELIEQLIPYVNEMGYTHIEVLPVSEHPFTGSWGYQPTGMFAPTSRFGDPDGFKRFVDACHQANIGVIVDWVPAHFPEDAHGLAKFDGTHLYDYEDPKKGWHPDWNSCIYDFGRESVRQFLVASALYWFDKFHVDGIRVDAVASMLYLDYSRNEGEWVPNIDGGNHNYEAISLLKWMNEAVHQHFPYGLTIAEESTSFSGVSKPTFEGGLGFDYKWNMGWMHDSLVYINKDPMYRKYHHNDITFSMVYNYDEQFVLPISHDEVVHGKGSMLRKMPGDEWQQAANLRAFAGYMYAHPGKKLNFMGNEFGQWEEWNHNSSLNWQALENDQTTGLPSKHIGIQHTYRDLNQVYVNQSALHELDHKHGGFDWIEYTDAEQSILSFVRRDSSGKEVVVVVNFTPVPREQYRLGVPQEGSYSILINTDAEKYGGSNYLKEVDFESSIIAWQNQAQSIVLDLPPLAAIYLVKK